MKSEDEATMSPMLKSNSTTKISSLVLRIRYTRGKFENSPTQRVERHHLQISAIARRNQ